MAGAICDSEFYLHPDYKSYCDSFCPEKTLTMQPCATSQTCSTEVCCFDECMASDYNAVCMTNIATYLRLSQTDYCTNKCTMLQFEFKHCDDRDCEDKDCFVKQCIHELFLNNYLVAPVCGTNYEYYLTQEEFCADKFDLRHVNPLSIQTCGLQEHCTSAAQCCLHNCEVEYNHGQFPTCDSDFEPYGNLTDFCYAFCPERKKNFLPCPANLNGFCSPLECCHQECMLGIYSGFCDSSYNYLTHTEYCDLKCTSPTVFLTCSFSDCSEAKCKEQKCLDKFE